MVSKSSITQFLSLLKPRFRSPSLPLLSHSPAQPFPFANRSPISPPAKTFCSSSLPNNRNPKLINFSLPSDSDSDCDSKNAPPKTVKKPNLSPPYNPFDKNPANQDSPADPTNLQEVFAKMRDGEGLMNSAAKMFDGLSRDGLTHEALALFSQIKDGGGIPDVVAYTAVMEAYVDAGQTKEAHKVYLRMLASGVLPNAYTYAVIVRGLAASGDARMAKEAAKYVGEMVKRGMRPNGATIVAVVEGLAEEEGRAVVEMVRVKGMAPEEEKVKEALKGKRGAVRRIVMDVLYGIGG